MDMIVCRNVLIYFSRELQNRVFGLFRDSLRPGGLLCLGSKESIRFSEHSDQFEDFDKKQKIYRKKGA
jgi:chemotaxis protein methyltransferase CheR